MITAFIIIAMMMMKAASIPETSVNYETTQRNIPDDSRLHNPLCFYPTVLYVAETHVSTTALYT
jgi:hypothetical protein